MTYTPLDKRLIEIGQKHGVSRVHYPSGTQCRCIEGPMGHFVREIYVALKEAGYATVRKEGYRTPEAREYTQYTITYPDGSGEFARVPLPLTSAQEWEQQALKAGWKPPEEPDTGDDEWPEVRT